MRSSSDGPWNGLNTGDQDLARQTSGFELHFTPTGSSWINQGERWFGYLAHQMIRRGAHKDIRALEADIRAWVKD
ncbi:hypothetical protein ACIGYR_16935 [Streptomyces sp. NPDC053076]|uniref:hypothetical protein n=1 Tax=Streptomyces sp. NPDC053076 TaxID=3365696 RepID=UPI0037D902DF